MAVTVDQPTTGEPIGTGTPSPVTHGQATVVSMKPRNGVFVGQPGQREASSVSLSSLVRESASESDSLVRESACDSVIRASASDSLVGEFESDCLVRESESASDSLSSVLLHGHWAAIGTQNDEASLTGISGASRGP